MLLPKSKYSKSIFLFLLFATNLYSQEIILTGSPKTPINISSNMALFLDSTAQLTLEQVITKAFIPLNKDHFIFPFSNNIYWVKFQLKNVDVKNKDWIIRWNNPLVEQLDFYISDSLQKNYQHSEQKLYTTQKLKKLYEEEPHFAFELAPNTTKTLFIKLSSKRGHYGSIHLYSNTSFVNFRYDNFAQQGVINGLIFFRLLLVIILGFFIVKELAFKAYSFQVLLKTAAFWALQNILGPIFTDNPAWAAKINIISTNSTTIGMSVFLLAALAIDKLPKWVRFTFYFFIFVTMTINVVIWMDYQWYWLKATFYNTIICALFAFTIYGYSIYKKLPINIYYSIPFLLGHISYLLINMRILTGIEYKPLFSIGSFLFLSEIFVFIIFLGQIFRKAEVSKWTIQQKLDFNIEQNIRLQELDALKTNFFTNISHEIRTPLTLITAPLQELIAKYPSDSLIPLIQRNAQRLHVLINQLLDISKLEAGQIQPEINQIELVCYLRTFFSSFTSLAQSRQIHFDIAQSHAEVWGFIDAEKLEKILANLLSNAFKFTNEGGKVSVSIDYQISQSSNAAQWLTIKVSDTGIGIAQKKIGQIFNRFYQVEAHQKRGYEGTGIGLALVKELVEVLKGTIRVNSQEKVGTTFTVSLPVDKATWKDYIHIPQQTQETVSPSSILNQVLGNHTPVINHSSTSVAETDNILLIIDDNADIRTFIRSVFENKYKIIEAVDGQEGIEKAIQLLPNTVICDLMMPRMDGFEFCKAMKTDERTSHIPIIMLTAKANTESRIEGFEIGADDYLTKPFNTEEIQARVKNLLDKQEKLKQYYTNNNSEHTSNTSKTNSIEHAFLHRAKEVVEKHLSHNSFDVMQFSQEMNMSTSQLLRKLKALTNQTVVEFIRDYRLQRAASLLSQGKGNVSEVALQVGFESSSYFTKVFLEKFGVVPSEYKN